MKLFRDYFPDITG